MFAAVPPKAERCRVVYVSPLKALAVDVERNLRTPIAGIARVAGRRGETVHLPEVAIRTGDTPSEERARMLAAPARTSSSRRRSRSSSSSPRGPGPSWSRSTR